MAKMELSALEKEALDFDFSALQAHAETATAHMVKAANVTDVKTQICDVWKKIAPFVKAAEAVPIFGKYVKILADLLDTICPA